MRYVALLLLLAACDSRHSLDNEQRQNAEYGALRYASGVGGSAVECSGLDSDGDGYVTCSYLPKNATAKTEIVCAYQSRGGGCKEKK